MNIGINRKNTTNEKLNKKKLPPHAFDGFMQGRMTRMNLSQSSYSMENQRMTASAVNILVCKCSQKFSAVFDWCLCSINFHIRHSQ